MTAFNTTPEAMSSEVTESDNTGSSITGSNVSSVCVCMGGGRGEKSTFLYNLSTPFKLKQKHNEVFNRQEPVAVEIIRSEIFRKWAQKSSAPVDISSMMLF